MEVIVGLGKILGLWLFAQYLIGPFLVFFATTAPDRYVLPRWDWTELVAKLGKPFADAHATLVRLGFVPCGATEVSNIKALLYVHPDDGCRVQLRHTKIGLSVCFSQEYAGGRFLLVSNSQIPGAFPPWDKVQSYLLYRCRDIPSLFDKFRRLRALCKCAGPVRANLYSELESTERLINAEMQQLIERGYYSARVSEGKRRVTLKGAFLATWKVAWPSKPIILALAQRRAENAMGSLSS